MSESSSSSPQGGNQQPGDNVPPLPPTTPVSFVSAVSTPSVGAASIGSSSAVGATSQHGHSFEDAGDVLQASTTVTSLAVALMAILPTSTAMAKLTVVTIGQWPIHLGLALLICGISALMSSVFSLDRLRRKFGMSGWSMLLTNIGLLYIALFLFLLIYLGIATSYVF